MDDLGNLAPALNVPAVEGEVEAGLAEQRAKLLDKASADFAADEAVACSKCRPEIPQGAECYLCWSGADDESGDLVRMCSCRGPHTGFVHIRCLVALAESKQLDESAASDRALVYALTKCGQCRQGFRGAVMVALARAGWRCLAGRAEANIGRLCAARYLGASLLTDHRRQEALTVCEDHLAVCQLVLGPNDAMTIGAEEIVAHTRKKLGGPAREYHQAMSRLLAWSRQHLGPEHNTAWEELWILQS